MPRRIPARIRKLMKELKQGLAQIYGDKLKAVYLYGSYARGDYREGSDVDVMILLKSYRNYWKEIERTSELISTVSLNYDILVSRVITSEEKWKRSENLLLKNIRREGLAA
jgi:predicted nucleotidyltransferase